MNPSFATGFVSHWAWVKLPSKLPSVREPPPAPRFSPLAVDQTGQRWREACAWGRYGAGFGPYVAGAAYLAPMLCPPTRLVMPAATAAAGVVLFGLGAYPDQQAAQDELDRAPWYHFAQLRQDGLFGVALGAVGSALLGLTSFAQAQGCRAPETAHDEDPAVHRLLAASSIGIESMLGRRGLAMYAGLGLRGGWISWQTKQTIDSAVRKTSNALMFYVQYLHSGRELVAAAALGLSVGCSLICGLAGLVGAGLCNGLWTGMAAAPTIWAWQRSGLGPRLAPVGQAGWAVWSGVVVGLRPVGAGLHTACIDWPQQAASLLASRWAGEAA